MMCVVCGVVGMVVVVVSLRFVMLLCISLWCAWYCLVCGVLRCGVMWFDVLCCVRFGLLTGFVCMVLFCLVGCLVWLCCVD